MGTLGRLARRLNRALESCAALLAILLLLWGSYCLWCDAAVRRQANLGGQVLQYKPGGEQGENPTLAELQKLNPDVIGWLSITDTPIVYPVVQGEDDFVYVNHNVLGEYAMSGAIFLSCQNSARLEDGYSLVYGHHMENRAMFGCLPEYLQRDFFAAHKTGVLRLPERTLKLTFFACVETDAADDWFYSTGRCCQNRAGLLRHIRSLGGVQMGTEPEETQGVAALSTCSDARTNGRVVLLAKIEPEEKRGAEML